MVLEDYIRSAFLVLKKEIIRELSKSFAHESWREMCSESITCVYEKFNWLNNLTKEISEYLSESFRNEVNKIDEIERVILEIDANVSQLTCIQISLSREQLIEVSNCFEKICNVEEAFQNERIVKIKEESKKKITNFIRRIFENANTSFLEDKFDDFMNYAKELHDVMSYFKDHLTFPNFSQQLSLELFNHFEQFSSNISRIIRSSYLEILDARAIENLKHVLYCVRSIDNLMHDNVLIKFNVHENLRDAVEKIQSIIVEKFEAMINDFNSYYDQPKPSLFQGILNNIFFSSFSLIKTVLIFIFLYFLSY